MHCVKVTKVMSQRHSNNAVNATSLLFISRCYQVLKRSLTKNDWLFPT